MDLQSFIEAVNALKTVTSVRDHKIYSDIRADSNHIIGYKESGLKFDISSHLLYTIFQRNPKTTTNQLKEYIKKWDRSVARAILHSLNKEVNNNQTIIETQIKKTKRKNNHKDESYIIDLCDTVMQEKAKRQYTFDFLLGDIGKNGRRRRLPVDAFYESRKLVIEYWEKQHFESVPIYNKNTISGERDKQRRIYDQRRKELLPKNGINLIIIPYYDFKHRSNGKLIRDYNKDIAVVKKSLCNYL